MKIEVQLYTQSHPIEINNVRNAYTKGSLYCVMLTNGTVYKFPLEHIFRIKEFPKS